MNPDPCAVGFRRQLNGWMLRSLVCAAPSFCWAWAVGLRDPAAVTAMILVIVAFAIAWSGLAGWLEQGTPRRRTLLRWLKRSAWIKAGTGLVTDFYFGALAAGLSERLTGTLDRLSGHGGMTVSDVALLTATQGALLCLCLGLIALTAWGLAGLWSQRRRFA